MKVIVYTTPACPYCIMVESFLKKNNVSFEEIDVSKNEAKKQEMMKKSGQMTVPVTDIGGKIIVGYDTKKMKEELGL